MGISAGFVVPHPPMIVPAVGRGSEKQVEETTRAYEEAARQIAKLRPETIVISSPHATMYSDYFHISPGRGAGGSFDRFGAPLVKFDVRYDEEFTARLSWMAAEEGVMAGTAGQRDPALDHGVMVPLYFIDRYYTDYKLVRIGLSGLSLEEHYRVGQLIAGVSEDLGRNTVYVASGDLSHKLQSYGPYGFAPEGPEYDKKVMDVCARGAFGELLLFDEAFCEKAAECGHRSIVMMAGAFDGKSVESRVLSHQDITGVGYGVCTFYPNGDDEGRCFLKKHRDDMRKKIEEKKKLSDEYVKLARYTVEEYVKKGELPPVPEDIGSELLSKRAGAFVSIHKNGRLRGCIGTISPVRENLALEIMNNAVSAATEDPRFDPISSDELDFLDIKVDELMPAEDISSPEELDVKKYGVIVTSGMKRGLLLPDLDGVDSVEQQIDIARQKAGISKGERLSLERFEVIRHT